MYKYYTGMRVTAYHPTKDTASTPARGELAFSYTERPTVAQARVAVATVHYVLHKKWARVLTPQMSPPHAFVA